MRVRYWVRIKNLRLCILALSAGDGRLLAAVCGAMFGCGGTRGSRGFRDRSFLDGRQKLSCGVSLSGAVGMDLDCVDAKSRPESRGVGGCVGLTTSGCRTTGAFERIGAVGFFDGLHDVAIHIEDVSRVGSLWWRRLASIVLAGFGSQAVALFFVRRFGLLVALTLTMSSVRRGSSFVVVPLRSGHVTPLPSGFPEWPISGTNHMNGFLPNTCCQFARELMSYYIG